RSRPRRSRRRSSGSGTGLRKSRRRPCGPGRRAPASSRAASPWGLRPSHVSFVRRKNGRGRAPVKLGDLNAAPGFLRAAYARLARLRLRGKHRRPMTQTPPAGILPAQSIEALLERGAVTSASAFDADQVQPASLDLRLGGRAWRGRASFLPGRGRTVAERIAAVAMHELDLTRGAVLERGCVYIAELQERLKLPPGVSARANPKSSTGRVDVFVRLLTDNGIAFDD